jgi:hypothetical protein
MHAYEIRIFRSDGAITDRMQVLNFSDHAAVRTAKKFAEARDFEVWREAHCIYGVYGHVAGLEPHIPPSA